MGSRVGQGTLRCWALWRHDDASLWPCEHQTPGSAPKTPAITRSLPPLVPAGGAAEAQGREVVVRQSPRACHLGGRGPGSSSELPAAHGGEALAQPPPLGSTRPGSPWAAPWPGAHKPCASRMPRCSKHWGASGLLRRKVWGMGDFALCWDRPGKVSRPRRKGRLEIKNSHVIAASKESSSFF